MDTQPLKLQVDSKQARADLAELAKALDHAGASVGKMQTAFASGMSGTDAALNKSMKSMEKFAEVATLIGKVKISGEPAQQLRQFANALTAMSRAKAIDTTQINNIKTLTRALTELKVPAGATRLTQFLHAVGSARAPSEGNVARLKDMLKLLANYKPTAATRNTEALARFFSTISNIKVPSESALRRLETLFKVLREAKGVPNASRIAAELDTVAAAATRAGGALNSIQRHTRGVGTSMTGVETSARRLHGEMARAPEHAAKASKGFLGLGNAIGALGERFKTGYQLGTVFSAMFSAFTVGQFLKSIYDINIGFLKLQKAMLFQTGTMEEAHKATEEFIAISDKLGLSVKDSMESYGRFAISAKASGLELKETNAVYQSVGTALQVVGADSHQASLAFFALTEMMQKGTVHSKEFNRQLGQQIPGNAVLGAQALSNLLNHYVSVQEFFQKMQKGQIMSNTFVPEYARVIDRMYGPLLGLVKMRPDAQLNSLKNAFVKFAQGVGDAGFLGALSHGLGDLHDKLIITSKDGTTHLTKSANDLANTLGKNLGQMIHVAVEGLGWMVTHISELVFGLKALLGLKVGATFLDWSNKAAIFSDKLIVSVRQTGAEAKATMDLARAKRVEAAAAKASETAFAGTYNVRTARTGFLARRAAQTPGIAYEPLGDARAFKTFNGVSGVMAGGTAAAMEAEMARQAAARARVAANYAELPGSYDLRAGGALSGGLQAAGAGALNAPRLAANPTYSPGAGAATFATGEMFGGFSAGGAAIGAAEAEKALSKTAFSLKELGVVGATAGRTFGGVLKSGLSSAWNGAMSFGKWLPSFGTLAIGAAVALAVFSDKITDFQTKAGNAVKVGDIVSGFFDTLGKDVTQLAGLTTNLDGSLSGSGKSVLIFLTAVEMLVKGITLIGTTIGRAIGTMVSNIITMIYSFGVAIAEAFKGVKDAAGAALHGDLSGANKALSLHFGKANAAVDASAKETDAQWVRADSATAKDFAALNPEVIASNIANAAAKAANTRGNQTAADVQQEAVYKNAEEQLAASQKQQADEQARGEIEALNRRIAMGDMGIPKLSDLLKQIDETAKNQTTATEQTAKAAEATANAAKTAAGAPTGAVMSGVKGGYHDPTGAVKTAIDKAAADKGVDPKLLYRIAWQESAGNYDVNSKAGSTSAKGLFQITGATAETLGMPKDSIYNVDAQAQAAAKYAKINAAFLENHLHREATGGEIYGAHFLGPAGALQLIRANEKNPNGIAADQFKTAAQNNPGIFYADSKHRSGPRTFAQVTSALNQVGSGQTGLTGKMLEPATTDDEESLTKKADSAISRYQQLIGQHNPGQQAASQLNEFLVNMQSLIQLQGDLRDKGIKNFIDPAAVTAEAKRLKQLAADAANPFSKESRVGTQANDVTSLRLKGLEDEADFREKLNQLDEQGYDITKLDTQANRDAIKAVKDRTDALAAQIETVKALNEAHVASVARSGTAQQVAFSRLVQPKPGQTYAQAVAEMEPAELAATQRTAAVQVNSQTAGAAYDLAGQIKESATASRLSPSAKTLRNDYKGFLEQLSGVADASLDRLEKKTDPALQAMAKHAAEIKQAIDNPPGFQKWADGLEPLKKRLEDIKANFAEGLSQNITDAMYGEKVDWRAFSRNIAKQVTKAQVDSVIGGMIQKITGKGALTPEQQATVDAADALSKAADAAASAQTSAADAASTSLTTSATNLTGAATDLKSAAHAIVEAVTGAAQAANDNGVSSAASVAASGTAAAPSVSDADFLKSAGVDAAGSNHIAGVTVSGGSKRDLGLTALPDAITASAPSLTPADLVTPPDTTGFKSTAELMSSLPNIDPATGGDGGASGGIMGMLKGAGSKAFGLLGLLGPLLLGQHTKTPKVYPAINGVIGESRPVSVTGREIAAHSNVVGDLLNMGLSAFTGGFGQGGGMSIGKTFGNMGASMSKNMGGLSKLFGQGGGMSGIGKLFGSMGSGMGGFGSFLAGLFSEGGYSTEPVGSRVMSMHAWRDAPHYAEGTHNTSGGMPAILHPDEAVIPLSRGRSIPVDLGGAGVGGGQQVNVHSNITIVAPNPDAFRQSRGALQRQTNRDMKRAAVRNLSPH